MSGGVWSMSDGVNGYRQSLLRSPWKKVRRLEKKYANAVTGVTDYYEEWQSLSHLLNKGRYGAVVSLGSSKRVEEPDKV